MNEEYDLEGALSGMDDGGDAPPPPAPGLGGSTSAQIPGLASADPRSTLQMAKERMEQLTKLKEQMHKQAQARQAAMEQLAQAYSAPVDNGGVDPGLIALGRGVASAPNGNAVEGFLSGVQGMQEARQKLAERDWARKAAAQKIRAEAEQQKMVDVMNEGKLDASMMGGSGHGRAGANIREYTNENGERVQVVTDPYTGEMTQRVLGKVKSVGAGGVGGAHLKAGMQWMKNPDGTPQLDEQGMPVQGAVTNVTKTTGAEPSLSPEALNDAAINYNKSGTLPPNMGRGTQGAANSTAIQNLAAKQRRSEGLDPNRLLDVWGIRKGQTGAYADISKRVNKIDLAVNEGLSSMQITKDAMANLPRTSFPAINGGMQFFEKHMGDPALRAAQASINTFVNTYSRAISPTGQTSISDKDHARELLSTVDGPEAFGAVMSILEKEMHTAKASALRTIQEAEPGAKSSSPTSNTHPPKNSKGWELHTDGKGRKAYVSPDGKQYEVVK